MNRRPLSITLFGWLFIGIGCSACASGLVQLVRAVSAEGRAGFDATFQELWMMWLSQTAALVAGVFLLRGRNWARWLLVAWLAFHVAIGAMHGAFEFVFHALLFVGLSYLLFRSAASAYFRGESASSPPASR